MARRWGPRLLGLILLVWAFATVGFSWGAIASGGPAMIKLVGPLLPPDVSPDFLSVLWQPVLETLSLSVIGMGLAIVLGVPLAIAGTATFWSSTRAIEEPRAGFGTVLYHVSRRLLDFFRAVPDLAWALLFVAAVGLGALPALVALALSYAGMVGKGVSEILEGMDPRPQATMRAMGAGRLAALVWATLPQAWPQVVAYLFYCWECSMRASALMGFVGAGGIGYQIDLSMRMFEFRQVSTLIIALLLLVGLVDLTSHLVRRLLQPASTPTGARVRRLWGRVVGTLAVGAFGLGLWSFRDSWAQLFSGESASHLARFLQGCWPLAASPDYLKLVVTRLMETLAISVAATALGAVGGAMLCVLASRADTFTSEPPRGPLAWLLRLGFVGSRAILNLLRSVPEVLWALLMVVAVGLGPFAGTLALGIHTGGVLGKLYAELLEESDFAPVHALTGLGAPVLSAIAYGALPVAMPTLVAYTLLRWEVNLRVATILGFVGGGGLGQELWNQIQLGFYDRVATITLFVFVVVIGVDRLSSGLRRSLAKV